VAFLWKIRSSIAVLVASSLNRLVKPAKICGLKAFADLQSRGMVEVDPPGDGALLFRR